MNAAAAVGLLVMEMIRTLAGATPIVLATAPRNASLKVADCASTRDTPSIVWSALVMVVRDSAVGNVGVADGLAVPVGA